MGTHIYVERDEWLGTVEELAALKAETERLRETLDIQFPGLVEISKDAERYRGARERMAPYYQAVDEAIKRIEELEAENKQLRDRLMMEYKYQIAGENLERAADILHVLEPNRRKQ